jgi:hypothetical protein
VRCISSSCDVFFFSPLAAAATAATTNNGHGTNGAETKARRRREAEERAEAERDLMASLLRREQDFLDMEETMLDGMRQKYKSAFTDDVSPRLAWAAQGVEIQDTV